MAEIIWAALCGKRYSSYCRIYSCRFSSGCKEYRKIIFFEKAKVLELYPLIGKPVPEIKVKYFREILVSRYRIIYEIFLENQVDILSVHHQSRLLKNNPTLKKRLRK